MSKAFLKWLWHTKPILFEKFFASAMCIRQIYVLSDTQVNIVCSCCDFVQSTLGTRHTDWDDMQFKVVFLVVLITVKTIWIISIYLVQNWAVSQDCLLELPIWKHGVYCLRGQTAIVDRSRYNISLSHYKLIRNFNLFQPYKFSKFSDRLNTCIVKNCYTDTQNNLCIIW